MKKLLLALDHSDESPLAVAHTKAVARRFEAEVRVVHALIGPPFGFEEAHQLVQQAVFDLGMAGIGATGGLFRCDPHLVGRRLAAEAAREGVDLIVLGTRRTRGLARLRAGGVREQLMRHTSLPILLGPSPLDLRPHRWRRRRHDDRRPLDVTRRPDSRTLDFDG
ncbi:MAG TPA: universal stress protein [Acidimicrobiales bacterium]|nr:universal stress protein [Acidimicrobiales bacterium]